MSITLDLTVPNEIHAETQTDVTVSATGHQYALLDWGDGEYKVVDETGIEITGAQKQNAINTLRNVVASQASLTGSITETGLSEVLTGGLVRLSQITAMYYLGGGYIAAFDSAQAYLYKLDESSSQLTLLASAACKGNPSRMYYGNFLTYTVTSPNTTSRSLTYTIVRFDTAAETITTVIVVTGNPLLR